MWWTYAALILLLACTTPLAADEEAQALSEPTYRRLAEIHDGLLGKNRPAEAARALQELLPKVAGSRYETAVVYQNLGHAYLVQGDQERAAEAFEQSLAQDALPEQIALQMQYGVAQIRLAQGRPREAIRWLEQWFAKNANASADAHVLAAAAYQDIRDYRRAVTHIERAISASGKFEESWHQLLIACLLELGEHRRAARALVTLISKVPDKLAYWQQLAAVYMEMKEPMRALALQTIETRLHPPDARTVSQLADFYRQVGIPLKAAELLQKGMQRGLIAADADNTARLAETWLQAREYDRALEALQQAHEMQPRAQLQYQRAQILMSRADWKNAMSALQQALRLDNFEQRGQAWLMLGIAAHETGRIAQARESFQRATEYPEARSQASNWLRFIDAMPTSEE
jgi:tetratricopeptide (TPR) repeat protein